jgi:hypothetical protein
MTTPQTAANGRHDYAELSAFTKKVQRFNALQRNARETLLIHYYGDIEGGKIAERFDKYGLWFTLHELTDEQEQTFYTMVLEMA